MREAFRLAMPSLPVCHITVLPRIPGMYPSVLQLRDEFISTIQPTHKPSSEPVPSTTTDAECNLMNVESVTAFPQEQLPTQIPYASMPNPIDPRLDKTAQSSSLHATH